MVFKYGHPTTHNCIILSLNLPLGLFSIYFAMSVAVFMPSARTQNHLDFLSKSISLKIQNKDPFLGVWVIFGLNFFFKVLLSLGKFE